MTNNLKTISLITLFGMYISACSTQSQPPGENLLNGDIKNISSEHDSKQDTTATRLPITPAQLKGSGQSKTDKSGATPVRAPEQDHAAQLVKPAPPIESRSRVQSRVTRKEKAYDLATKRHLFRPNQEVEPTDREKYAHYSANPVHLAAEQPVSTFSIDVDSGSYTNVRRLLHDGRLPRKDAVRIEEFINYFSYSYPLPEQKQLPFTMTTELGPAPWNSNSHLLQVGIKAYDVESGNLPASNLVFLIDVSGSMNSKDKLPLLKNAFKLLTNKLRPQDKVAIVVYAGASGTVLDSTPGNQRATILNALQNLVAGGSTNGAAGIHLAYQLARQSFISDGINRVILATDGDFNVGTVNQAALKDLIENQRKSGISLTTLGFGRGNYNDALMEQLADVGNGNYAYIDNLLEAQKSLVDQIGSTLFTVAKDVKIQIEFNPAVVREYRLVGYDNRILNREDFNNDKVDAGDIGAGHTVTALYEISLVNSETQHIDPLRYQSKRYQSTSNQEHASKPSAGDNNELAFLKIRYKQPDSDISKLLTRVIKTQAIQTDLAKNTQSFQFAASVAGFGQLLRGGKYLQGFNFEHVVKLAQQSKGVDPSGYRGEFINLVKLARSLQGNNSITLND